MINNTFSIDDLPHDILEHFGLNEEMIEDLPEPILEDIYNGRRSPVITVDIKNDNGDSIGKFNTRIALVRMDDGTPDMMFYPCKQSCDIDQYDEYQQEKLLQGKSVIDDVTTKDGTTLRAFIQVDRETNHILYVPTPVIGKNIQILADDFDLSPAELQSLHNGEPFTFMTDGEPITVGIDLKDKTGIRFCAGDVNRWLEMADKKLDKFNFGINGCWVQADDGSLGYVKEEDYTEEIIEEQKKMIAHNQTISRHF